MLVVEGLLGANNAEVDDREELGAYHLGVDVRNFQLSLELGICVLLVDPVEDIVFLQVEGAEFFPVLVDARVDQSVGVRVHLSLGLFRGSREIFVKLYERTRHCCVAGVVFNSLWWR